MALLLVVKFRLRSGVQFLRCAQGQSSNPGTKRLMLVAEALVPKGLRHVRL